MKNVNGLLAMKEGRPVTERVVEEKPGDVQIFTECWALGIQLWTVRALHSGLPPKPARAWAQLGRVWEDPFIYFGTNKGSGAGLSQTELSDHKSANLSV